MNEGELLLTELLSCSRDKLYLNKGYRLSQKERFLLAGVLKRRFLGEPIQYILGKTEFMGFEFRLFPDVFIPRPETEILVEAALKICCKLQAIPRLRSPRCRAPRQQAPRREAGQAGKRLEILDIGTGSGCIAISLAKFLKDVKIYATDISREALEVAKENALLNNVEINFLRCNLFSNSQLLSSGYDLIVANPPYIPRLEIKKLQPELSYEPAISLDGGGDGLDFYRRIIKGSVRYLKKGGFLILEMGFNQCSAIKKIFTPLEKTLDRVKENSLTGFNSIKKFEIIEVIKDYNNIDRVIVARYG